jgi:ubiquinone/menaquinone biosynthesis C-methylase UbiE
MAEDRRIRDERRFWSRQAPKYDNWIKNSFDAQYDIFRAKFKSAVEADDSILEIGTGTGDIALNIAPKCKNVIGIDISPEMISEANKKLAESKVRNVKFQIEDAYNLSFEDDTFDKVICSNALQTMAEPGRAVREAHRVLKTGGEFISTTYCYGDSGITELFKLLKFALKRGRPKYWKNLNRKEVLSYFNSTNFEVLEQKDLWGKPVVLYLRCKKR